MSSGVRRLTGATAVAPARALDRRLRSSRSPHWYRRYERIQPWLYVGPAFIVTLVLVVAPVMYLVQASMKELQLGDPLGGAPFVGLDNYRTAFEGQGGLRHSLYLSAVYTTSTLLLELVFGMALALLIERLERALPFLMALMLVPMVLMPAMVAMVWRLYFSYEGLANWSVGLFGIDKVNWFSTDHALQAVIITDVWQWTPFFVLLFVAGLQNVPKDIKEAAEVDGASPLQLLRLVKLPVLRPLIIIAATLRVMELVRQFDLAFIMFGGGPGNATQLLPLAVHRVTMQQRNVGVGSVLSLGLVLIVVAISWGFISLMRRYRTDL